MIERLPDQGIQQRLLAQSSGSRAHRKRLVAAFWLTTVYLVVEVVGGILTHSLALLADAGHMLTDAGGLGLALFAVRVAERPANPELTYGYYRAEILAALANTLVLILLSFYILYEAYRRFQAPPEVRSGAMLIVASVGLLVNITGIQLLHGGSKESLNVKGAYFEVLSDLLGSVGVIAAALVIRFTGWLYADPLISAGIGLFILPRAWRLLREALGILLEGTPSDVNIAALREAVSKIGGVRDVHDLHVWSLTSGINAMSLHVIVDDDSRHDEILRAIQQCATSRFPIAHATVQIDCGGCAETEAHL